MFVWFGRALGEYDNYMLTRMSANSTHQAKQSADSFVKLLKFDKAPPPPIKIGLNCTLGSQAHTTALPHQR